MLAYKKLLFQFEPMSLTIGWMLIEIYKTYIDTKTLNLEEIKIKMKTIKMLESPINKETLQIEYH